MTNDRMIFKDECYAIVGACFEVYKDKGCGFHEPVYQECLSIELEHCRIPAIAQPALISRSTAVEFSPKNMSPILSATEKSLLS